MEKKKIIIPANRIFILDEKRILKDLKKLNRPITQNKPQRRK